MAEKVSVSGPIAVRSDSSDRVAFDLMDRIAAWENAPEDKKRTREYWLTLFFQCKEATRGGYLDSVLKPQ